MKTYNEMAEDALLRIKKQREKIRRRNKIITGTAVPLISLVMLSGIGFTAWQMRRGESQTDIEKSAADIIPNTDVVTVYEKNKLPNNSSLSDSAYSQTPIITHGDKTDSNTSPCYAAPEKGEVRYTTPLALSRSNYEGQDVRFLVTIYLNSCEYATNGGMIPLSEDEEMREFARLSDTGIEFREIEYPTYFLEENGESVYKNVPLICAVMTEEQFENFDVNPDYGYFIDFPIGPYSDITIDINDSKIITDFPCRHT